MKREDKALVIKEISEKLKQYPHFYIADIAGLDAEKTSALRRQCFKSGVELKVVKNTLLKKAFDASELDFSELESVLVGNTAVMFTETANAPAKLIKDIRKTSEKPVLKAAYAEESVYIGDENLDTLTTIKSREELIGDIVLLLQSPAKSVISALQSSADTITGVLKTLEEKEN